MRASSAGGFGLALLCGTMLFVGCGDDSGDGDRTGGAGGNNTAGSGTAGSSTAGTGGATGGTGGTAGGGGTGGTGMMLMCTADDAVPGAVITDFNGTSNSFTDGGYYIYADQAAGGPTEPSTNPDDGTPTIAPEAGGREGNALHFSGTGFQGASWGAGVGVWLNCLDASGVEGMSFWYQSDQPIRVSVPIPETSNPEFTNGGECTLGDQCRANYVELPASPGMWAEAVVEFSELDGGSAAFDATRVMGVDILIPGPGGTDDWDFDIMVDDLSWLGEGTGTGGSGAGGDGAGGAAAGAGGAG